MPLAILLILVVKLKQFYFTHSIATFTFVQNDIYAYTVILFFPICVDKFLTDVNLLGLEVT